MATSGEHSLFCKYLPEAPSRLRQLTTHVQCLTTSIVQLYWIKRLHEKSHKRPQRTYVWVGYPCDACGTSLLSLNKQRAGRKYCQSESAHWLLRQLHHQEEWNCTQRVVAVNICDVQGSRRGEGRHSVCQEHACLILSKTNKTTITLVQ